jgi:hypothetical protein
MTADMHLESAFQYLDRAEAIAGRDPSLAVETRDASEARAGHFASMATAHFLAARAMGLQ